MMQKPTTKKYNQQMGNCDKQWKDHANKETTAWTDRIKQVKQNNKTTTNQTIKVYKTMNATGKQNHHSPV
jgi:hypothetical protein